MGIRFENIPSELQDHSGWVLWRYGKKPNARGKYPKEPFQSRQPYYHARVNKPNTWAPYDKTKHVYWPKRDNGVGIVLDGSGLAGMDYDGTTSDKAIEHAYGSGARYIEYSPSGNGFRALGFFEGDIPRKQGIVDGLHLEIYNSGRFLTVTGNSIVNEPLIDLNLGKVSQSLITTQGTQGTQGTQDRCVCVEPVALERLLPTGKGQRNSLEFALARYLRGRFPDADAFDCMDAVDQWYQMALPVIGTKDWFTTWSDFCRAFEAVKSPYGGVFDSLVAGFENDPRPAGVDERVTGFALQLAKLCKRLQDHQGDQPFYLSSRKAAELLGTDHVYISRLFHGLRGMRVLDLIEKGTKKTGNASSYRFIARETT